MQKRIVRNVTFILVFLGLVLSISLAGLMLIACTTMGGNSEKQNRPSISSAVSAEPLNAGLILPLTNLEGTWSHTTAKGGIFEATIDDKTIKIIMKDSLGSSMVYWNGTFASNQSVGSTVISNVIDDKAVLSRSQTKDFKVGDETLSFSFTAMGVTKTVELKRV